MGGGDGQDAAGEPATPAPTRRRRRWPWIVLLALVALLVALRVALPTLVERAAAWGSRRYVGLPGRIDAVHFDLLRGGVVLEGVSVAARPDGVSPVDAALHPPAIDPATALVHVDRIGTRLVWRDLRDRVLHLRELSIEAPSVRVAREPDGSIDPLRYAVPAVPPSAPEPRAEAEPTTPWGLKLDSFALRAPHVVVVDPARKVDLLDFSLDSFSLDEVAVKGSDVSLGGVGIEKPVLRVRRDLVFAAPGTPATAGAAPNAPATPAAAVPAAPAAAAPSYRVSKIDIDRATFTWITKAGPLNVALGLHASDIRTAPGSRFPVDLTLEIQRGRMQLQGQAGIFPPAYRGSLSWSGLPMPPLLLAGAAPELTRWLRSADASGALQIDADLGAKRPVVRVTGQTSVRDLSVADPSGEQVSLGWKFLEVGIDEVLVPIPRPGVEATPMHVALGSVKLVDPTVRYTRPSPALDALLGGGGGSAPASGATAAAPAAPKGAAAPPPAAPAPEAAAPAPVDLSVGALDVTGGDVEVLDRTVDPPARTDLKQLAVAARDIRFPATAARSIELRAQLPGQGRLDVKGDLEAIDRGAFTIALTRLPLPPFNPYASAAGASVDSGRATLRTRVRLRGPVIEADNELLLNRLGISLHDPGSFQERFGVPIDLALALLRDPAGNIRLSVPVKMDQKGAGVSIGSVVASALRQALVGALTAPLKLAGAAFSGLTGGGGGAERVLSIEPLGCVPGQPALDADATGRIDGLTKLLAQRPEIGLSLRGRIGPADLPLVAAQILSERWQAKHELPPLADTSFFQRRRIGQALDRVARGEPLGLEGDDLALYHRYVAAVPVPPERRAALARARAERARAALVAKGIAPERLTVGDAEAEGDPGVVLGFHAA